MCHLGSWESNTNVSWLSRFTAGSSVSLRVIKFKGFMLRDDTATTQKTG